LQKLKKLLDQNMVEFPIQHHRNRDHLDIDVVSRDSPHHTKPNTHPTTPTEPIDFGKLPTGNPVALLSFLDDDLELICVLNFDMIKKHNLDKLKDSPDNFWFYMKPLDHMKPNKKSMLTRNQIEHCLLNMAPRK